MSHTHYESRSHRECLQELRHSRVEIEDGEFCETHRNALWCDSRDCCDSCHRNGQETDTGNQISHEDTLAAPAVR